MRANDLMIKDWVYQALYQDTEIPNKGHGWKEVRVTNCPFDEDWAISPIPLTQKILEKNGWTIKKHFVQYGNFGKEPPLMIWHTETNDVLRHAKNELEILDLSKSTGTYHISFQCMFVHELQHALRLCGLNELADNFVV